MMKMLVLIYIGNSELIEGENDISIVVTAEDGTQRTYTIKVTKTDNAEVADATLKSLQIKGFELYPSFVKNIYKYNLTINEDIRQIEILAEQENENATVEIQNNTNLKKGNNIITIIVTAEDGITKRKYTINTFISNFNVEVEEEDKLPPAIAIIICIFFILILGIYIISKGKK